MSNYYNYVLKTRKMGKRTWESVEEYSELDKESINSDIATLAHLSMYAEHEFKIFKRNARRVSC